MPTRSRRSITPWSEIELSILGAVFEYGFDPEDFGLSQFARSGIVREIVRPSLHQDPSSIEQVRSRVGRLDLAPDGMR